MEEPGAGRAQGKSALGFLEGTRLVWPRTRGERLRSCRDETLTGSSGASLAQQRFVEHGKDRLESLSESRRGVPTHEHDSESNIAADHPCPAEMVPMVSLMTLIRGSREIVRVAAPPVCEDRGEVLRGES